MSKPIKTYADFLQEKERLKLKLEADKIKMTDNWLSVKKELAPVGGAIDLVSKLSSSDKRNPLLNAGLGIASDLIFRRLIFAKAGWITRLAAPLLVKNFSSHLLADKGNAFLGKIKRILAKKTKRGNEPTSTKNEDTNSFSDDLDSHTRNGQVIG